MIIELNIVTVVSVASCIVAVGGAIKVLLEFKKAVLKPLEEANGRLDYLETCLEKDKKHLDKIDVVIEEIGDAINLLVPAVKVSLEHMKDGNNTGEMSKQIEAMETWLIERKDYKI